MPKRVINPFPTVIELKVLKVIHRADNLYSRSLKACQISEEAAIKTGSIYVILDRLVKKKQVKRVIQTKPHKKHAWTLGPLYKITDSGSKVIKAADMVGV